MAAVSGLASPQCEWDIVFFTRMMLSTLYLLELPLQVRTPLLRRQLLPVALVPISQGMAHQNTAQHIRQHLSHRSCRGLKGCVCNTTYLRRSVREVVLELRRRRCRVCVLPLDAGGRQLSAIIRLFEPPQSSVGGFARSLRDDTALLCDVVKALQPVHDRSRGTTWDDMCGECAAKEQRCTFGFAGLALAAGALLAVVDLTDGFVALPLPLAAGAPDSAEVAGLAPPGLPKNVEMSRCFRPAPDMVPTPLGSLLSR